MARRLYKGPQSKISRSLCFFHESRDRASLFQSKRNIYPTECHLDQIFSMLASSPSCSPCLRLPFEITFPRSTSSDTSRTGDRGDRGFEIKLKLSLRWIRFEPRLITTFKRKYIRTIRRRGRKEYPRKIKILISEREDECLERQLSEKIN